jgi:hypothetical protein
MPRDGGVEVAIVCAAVSVKQRTPVIRDRGNAVMHPLVCDTCRGSLGRSKVSARVRRPLKSLRGRESTVGNGRSSTHSTCDAHAIPPCSTAPGETGSVTARASDNMAYYESAAARLGEAQGYPRRPSLLPQPKHDARGPHHQPPPTRGGHSRAIVHHARHGVNKNDYDEDSPLLLIGVLSMGNTTAPVGTNTAHTGSGYDDVEVHTAHRDCPYEVITALKHMSPPGDTPAGSM